MDMSPMFQKLILIGRVGRVIPITITKKNGPERRTK
jgi:hypothetical protein